MNHIKMLPEDVREIVKTFVYDDDDWYQCRGLKHSPCRLGPFDPSSSMPMPNMVAEIREKLFFLQNPDTLELPDSPVARAMNQLWINWVDAQPEP